MIVDVVDVGAIFISDDLVKFETVTLQLMLPAVTFLFTKRKYRVME